MLQLEIQSSLVTCPLEGFATQNEGSTVYQKGIDATQFGPKIGITISIATVLCGAEGL